MPRRAQDAGMHARTRAAKPPRTGKHTGGIARRHGKNAGGLGKASSLMCMHPRLATMRGHRMIEWDAMGWGVACAPSAKWWRGLGCVQLRCSGPCAGVPVIALLLVVGGCPASWLAEPVADLQDPDPVGAGQVALHQRLIQLRAGRAQDPGPKPRQEQGVCRQTGADGGMAFENVEKCVSTHVSCASGGVECAAALAAVAPQQELPPPACASSHPRPHPTIPPTHTLPSPLPALRPPTPPPPPLPHIRHAPTQLHPQTPRHQPRAQLAGCCRGLQGRHTHNRTCSCSPI